MQSVESMPPAAELKVVLIGDSAVGKTSLFLRMKGEDFVEDQTSTIGGACSIFTVQTDNGKVELNMWDTAGQEKFRTIVPMYFRNASVVLLVFDLTMRNTFDSIGEWIQLLRDKAPETIKLILVGNKSDKRKEIPEHVQLSELLEAGEKYDAVLSIETSALSGVGIDILKETIANQYFEIKKAQGSGTVVLDSPSTESASSKQNQCC